MAYSSTQVPADDPGRKLAKRRVSIAVGAAGDRQKRCDLGVAQPDEGVGDAAEDEGEHDTRAGIVRRGGSVRTKMPAPMMAPIPIAVMLKGPSAFARPCSAASPLPIIAASGLRFVFLSAFGSALPDYGHHIGYT